MKFWKKKKSNEIEVKIKQLHKDAVIPKYAHDTDTGFDLFSIEETTIQPRSKAIIKTGLAFGLPSGWGIDIRNKSGITIKGVPTVKGENKDLTVYLVTIDESYVGEVGIMVKNETGRVITVPKGIKVAQGVLERVYRCKFKTVDELNSTKRGEGGFGSTGVTNDK